MSTPSRRARSSRTPRWRFVTRVFAVLALSLFIATDPSIGQDDDGASNAPAAPTAVAASARIVNHVVITID